MNKYIQQFLDDNDLQAGERFYILDKDYKKMFNKTFYINKNATGTDDILLDNNHFAIYSDTLLYLLTGIAFVKKKPIPTINSQLVDIQQDFVKTVDDLVGNMTESLKEYNPSLVIDEKFEKAKLKKQKRFNKLRNKALKFMKKYYNGENDVMLVITSNDAGLYFRELMCDTDENAVENTKNGGAKDVE